MNDEQLCRVCGKTRDGDETHDMTRLWRHPFQPVEPLPAPEGRTDVEFPMHAPDCAVRTPGRGCDCGTWATQPRTEGQAVVEALRRLDFAWGTTGRWDASFVPEVKAVLEALWAYDRAALARSTPAPRNEVK